MMRINLLKTKSMKRYLVYTTELLPPAPFDPTRVLSTPPCENCHKMVPVEKVGLIDRGDRIDVDIAIFAQDGRAHAGHQRGRGFAREALVPDFHRRQQVLRPRIEILRPGHVCEPATADAADRIQAI